MPRLKEELQFSDKSNAAPNTPLNGISLFNENGVLKILHADGTKETIKTSDDLDETFQNSNYYTKAEIQQLLTQAGVGIQVKVVDNLPFQPDSEDNGKIFLVEQTNGYKEYLFIDGGWEEIGNQDLSNYLTKAEFNASNGTATFKDWTD